MTAHVHQQSQGVSQLLCDLQLVSGCKKLAKEENILEGLALPLCSSPGCTLSKVSQYSTTKQVVPYCQKQQRPPLQPHGLVPLALVLVVIQPHTKSSWQK